MALSAKPWWVNLCIAVPFAAFWAFRAKRLDFAYARFSATLLFGAAFGLVEAAVVIYLRAAIGMLDASAFPAPRAVAGLGRTLFTVELFREAATIVMLASVAVLAGKGAREKWAAFLAAFATWDISYYLFLWIAIGWPPSLTAPDVLFLLPVPWYAQVWFPLLVSFLTLAAVLANIRRPASS